jgi:pimeloyl-ACP methyl ester carboxylesterase
MTALAATRPPALNIGREIARIFGRRRSRHAAPSTWLLLAEGGRAAIEGLAAAALWPLLKTAPRGDGHAVLVLPGLVAGDWSTRVLRDYLRDRGSAAHGWGLGTNLGPRKGVEDDMLALLEELAGKSGGKVSIVGWSLGGVYARLLAAQRPDLVRSVVTLGSPFRGSPKATNATRIYELASGQSADDPRRMAMVEPTPPVPTTSIFSRSDGVVSWRSSLEQAGPTSESIEVIASHLGLGAHPAVLYALADRLAQPEGAWRPFDRLRLGPLVYPDPTRKD